jgi:callose synthase
MSFSKFQQKLAKREGGAIDRSQDIAKLQEFYKLYREKHKVDELCEDEMKLRESAVFSGNLGEYVYSLRRPFLKVPIIFSF